MAEDIGTGAEAIEYAISVDDHFDRLQFLQDWLDGSVLRRGEWDDYAAWLKKHRAQKGKDNATGRIRR